MQKHQLEKCSHSIVQAHFVHLKQGSYGSWKTWKVMEFQFFIFQALKVMENENGHGKSWNFNS